MIVSGALWDLRKAFIAQLGHDPGVALTEKIFLGVLRRAADLPTSYDAALIADDDDGDLGTARRTSARSSARSASTASRPTTPISRSERRSSPTRRSACRSRCPPAGACPVRQVLGMHVLWKVGDGVVNDLELAPNATNDAWTGAIAAQPDGTVVSYSVDITLDDGTQRSLPDNPADPMYQVFIGNATPIWCEPFDHAPSMWTTGGTAPAEWQWARPSGLAGRVGRSDGRAHRRSHLRDEPRERRLVRSRRAGHHDDAHDRHERVPDHPPPVLALADGRRQPVRSSLDDREHRHAWHNATSSTGTLPHVDREWRFQDIDLTPHLDDNTVAVTWQLQTDGTGERGGWNLDDVCIVGMAKVPLCGDGFLDVGEECDDGNTFSGDGCTDKCVDELAANGGGGCCSASGGAAGSGLLALISAAILARGRGRRDRSPRASRSTRGGRAGRSGS